MGGVPVSLARNSAAAKARAGREFLSPQPPFPPAPPERSGVLFPPTLKLWRAGKMSPNFLIKAAPDILYFFIDFFQKYWQHGLTEYEK